jgi:ATP-dependent protease ClpP protease subunit
MRLKKIKRELYEVISYHTGKPVKQVEKDCDRDFWDDFTGIKRIWIGRRSAVD